MKRFGWTGALVALFVLGLAVNGVMPGLAGVSALFGTTTQSSVALVTGTGDFTYDGQTVHASSFPNMGNGDNGKLLWIRTPLNFDCAPGSLTVSEKKVFGGGPLTYTFTVGNGSDPAVASGSVIVGVLVHSGNEFNILSAEWATNGSAVTVALDKGYSNAAVFSCAPVRTGTTDTTDTTDSTSTSYTTDTTDTTDSSTTETTGTATTESTKTVTVTQPVTTVQTVTQPGGATTVTLPAQTVTQTTPGGVQTVTTPGQTVTTPGQTVTTPGTTVTVPGKTVAAPRQPAAKPATKPHGGVLAAHATLGKRLAHTK
jgi:hypothetical protein